MSQPKSDTLPTGVPLVPPVYFVLLNNTFWTACAKPNVITARLTPRVRNAGRAKSRPTSVAARTPPANASGNGHDCELLNRPATSAPMPANANWPNEIWPAHPMSTTSESATVAQTRVAPIRADHDTFVNQTRARNNSVATATTAGRGRPVPIRGSCCEAVSRPGMAEPREASTTTLTRTGSASLHPGALT